jgi:hypothetical protein
VVSTPVIHALQANPEAVATGSILVPAACFGEVKGDNGSGCVLAARPVMHVMLDPDVLEKAAQRSAYAPSRCSSCSRRPYVRTATKRQP